MLYRIIRICAALIGIIGVLCCKCCLVRVLLPFFLIIGSGSIAQDIYRHVPVMIEDESSGDCKFPVSKKCRTVENDILLF
ncbi:hypothetical protein OESDEN_17211 [Oesophagostomum dentatum]|uniref:Uncharacterized protein n=1 Tax=Oesophagostomum dentatum TaxID=61180 RepID=A0A0B1SHW6_OESDE|nr:hypothetical protein OESDEN_17211 [Oesophagostomum dentatum]